MSIQQPKILVADDSKTILHLVKLALEQRGYMVITALDGLAAIEKIFFESPHVVILDIMMPRMNGYQVCRFLRTEKETADIPIILLTGKINQMDRFWGMKVGADEYVTKPFEPYKLVDLVDNFIKNKKIEEKNLLESDFGRQLKRLADKVSRLRNEIPGATEADEIRLRQSEIALEVMQRINNLLDRRLFELTIIDEVTDLINSFGDFESIIKALLKKMAKVISYEIAIILLKFGEDAHLIFYVQKNVSSQFLHKIREHVFENWVKFSSYEFRKVFLKVYSGEEYFQLSDSTCGEYEDIDIQAYMYIPLKVRNELNGLLGVISDIPSKFTLEHKTTLEIFANQAAIILDNAIMFIKLKEYGDEKAIRLSTIYEIGRIMASAFDVMSLLQLVTEQITRVMKVKKCSLMLYNKKTDELTIRIGKGLADELIEKVKIKVDENTISGWVVRNRRPLLIEDIRKDKRFNFTKEERDYKTFSLMCVPIIVKEELYGVINVTEKEDGLPFNRNDLEMLSMLANQIGTAFESHELYRKLAEKERLDKELEIARSIQMNWLPKKCPDIPEIDLYGICIPAKEMSGDYFDYMVVNNNELALMIGDVSGKGVPAALAVIMIRSALRTEALSERRTNDVLKRINSIIIDDIAPDMFATLFFAKFNRKNYELRFANGGHEYPLLYRAQLGDFEELGRGGLLIGMFENVEYTEHKLLLNPGDTFILYTDGLTDVMNPMMEKYGIKRVKQCIRNSLRKSAKGIIESLIEDTMKFRGSKEPFDDITVLVLKVK